MRLAFYRGPADDWLHTLGHWLVCLFTFSRYSHVELVTSDGWCWSSSYRDGGVRRKRIDLTSGKWDVVDIGGDEPKAVAWFFAHNGQHYDWLGIVRFVLPFAKQRPGEYFCSEAVATALGLPEPDRMTPEDLFEHHIDI